MESQARYGAHSLTSEIRFLRSKAEADLQASTRKLEDVKKMSNTEKEVQEMLDDLPKKISHPVMVPFGGAAFFEGHLVHTNEVMVKLGDSYLVECSANHAKGIIDRRVVKFDSEAKSLVKRIESLRSEIEELQLQEDEGVVDIVEEYDESMHGSLSGSNLHAEGTGSKEDVPSLGVIPESVEEDDENGQVSLERGSNGSNDKDDDVELFAMMDRMAKLEAEAEKKEKLEASSSQRAKSASMSKGQGGGSRSRGLKKGFLSSPKRKAQPQPGKEQKNKATSLPKAGNGPEAVENHSPAQNTGTKRPGFMVERKVYDGGKQVAEAVPSKVVDKAVDAQVVERDPAVHIPEVNQSSIQEVGRGKRPISKFKEQMMKKREGRG